MASNDIALQSDLSVYTSLAGQAKKTFRKAVNKVSGLISTGHIRHFQPTQSASAKSLADERSRMRRLCAQRSKLTDTKTCGGRQANQMAIRRPQMRPQNSHIASMAACLEPKRQKTYNSPIKGDGPNGSCLFTAGSPPDTVDSQNVCTFSTRQIAFWWRSDRCRHCCSDFCFSVPAISK